jgi:2-phosphoglycerate kinase
MRKKYVISSSGEKIPFSKGVLVRDLTKAGLSVEESYRVAGEVQSMLKKSVTSEELAKLVYEFLKSQYGSRIANRYKQITEEKEVMVVEEDGKTLVPFSRGILAGSIRPAGVDVNQAFEIAREVLETLKAKRISVVSRKTLRKITSELLKERLGEETAKKYLLWRQIKKLPKPVIILIGGATGVGKSKLAVELTNILEINRMASTDAIREVMRKMISRELVPSIHVSSYEAGRVIPQLATSERQLKIVYGFLDQAEKVLTGVYAVISRAIKENISLIVEGIHLLPGYFERFKKKAYIVEIVLTTFDEEMHRSRFLLREEVSKRSSARYLKNFTAIRYIQDFIHTMAKRKGVPVIENIDFDRTRDEVVDVITSSLVNQIKVKL